MLKMPIENKSGRLQFAVKQYTFCVNSRLPVRRQTGATLYPCLSTAGMFEPCILQL